MVSVKPLFSEKVPGIGVDAGNAGRVGVHRVGVVVA